MSKNTRRWPRVPPGPASVEHQSPRSVGAPAIGDADGPRTLSSTERITLFVCATHKAQADILLAGFADRPRARAVAFAAHVRQWDSSTRQARLAREFGAPRAATERLQQLMVAASPGLRVALALELPAHLRALFPHLVSRAPVAPAMRAFATRLLREAMR